MIDKTAIFLLIPFPYHAPTPSELTFWKAQWNRRLSHNKKPGIVPSGDGVTFTQPEVPYTALYIMAKFRSHGWQTKIIDLNSALTANNSLTPTTVINLLGDISPDIVLMSPLTGNYSIAKEAVPIIRAQFPKATIAAGGAHASACSDEFISDGFDLVGIGPCEGLIEQLAGCKNFNEVYCGTWKEPTNSAVQENILQNWPLPAYEMLPERYRSSYYTRLFTAHGCPYRCVFCSDTVWSGRRPICKSETRVSEEIKAIKSVVSFSEIYVSDETFGIDKNHSMKVAEILRQSNVPWGCESRIDVVTQELFNNIAKSGCVEIDFGIESLDRDVLRLANKRYDLDRVSTVLRDARSAGLRVHANLMVGLPGETNYSARKTIDQASKWLREGLLTTADYFITVPYPGCELHNYPERFKMRLRQCAWSDYREDGLPVYDLETMTCEEIYGAWIEGLAALSCSMNTPV
jgi:radical SAM superfamily enzyme YgiQ (UPF0313 family)